MGKLRIKIIGLLSSVILLSSIVFSGCGMQYYIRETNNPYETQTTSNYMETYTQSEPMEYATRNYDFVGSCTKLSGTTVVVVIYLNDNSSSWTTQRMDRVKYKIGIATDYIEEAANYYGQSAEFIYDDGYYSDLSYEYDYYGNITDFDSLDEYNYDPYQESLLEAINNYIPSQKLLNKYGADHIAYVGVMNKEGRSYAYQYAEEYDDYYFEECCCLFYTDKGYGEEEPPAVYAHEILHLFGAIDLYESEDPYYNDLTGRQYDYIIDYYPNEIMYTTYDEYGYSVQQRVTNDISELTAFYLGWTDQLPSRFLNLGY